VRVSSFDHPKLVEPRRDSLGIGQRRLHGAHYTGERGVSATMPMQIANKAKPGKATRRMPQRSIMRPSARLELHPRSARDFLNALVALGLRSLSPATGPMAVKTLKCQAISDVTMSPRSEIVS
jgi:hypothetical protein